MQCNLQCDSMRLAPQVSVEQRPFMKKWRLLANMLGR